MFSDPTLPACSTYAPPHLLPGSLLTLHLHCSGNVVWFICLVFWTGSHVYRARFELTTYYAAKDDSEVLIILLPCYVWVSEWWDYSVCYPIYAMLEVKSRALRILGRHPTKLVSSIAHSQDFFPFLYLLKCMCDMYVFVHLYGGQP